MKPRSEALRPAEGQRHFCSTTRQPLGPGRTTGVSLQLSGHNHGGNLPLHTGLHAGLGTFTYGLHNFGALQVYTSRRRSEHGALPWARRTNPEIVLAPVRVDASCYNVVTLHKEAITVAITTLPAGFQPGASRARRRPSWPRLHYMTADGLHTFC